MEFHYILSLLGLLIQYCKSKIMSLKADDGRYDLIRIIRIIKIIRIIRIASF